MPPHPRHMISVEPGSRLHAALGVDEIEVDSFHHQALDRVAPDLTVVARAPDGVVEAVELDGDGYVLAVQWELQEEWRVDRRFLGPFEPFAGLCHMPSPAARRSRCQSGVPNIDAEGHQTNWMGSVTIHDLSDGRPAIRLGQLGGPEVSVMQVPP